MRVLFYFEKKNGGQTPKVRLKKMYRVSMMQRIRKKLAVFFKRQRNKTGADVPEGRQKKGWRKYGRKRFPKNKKGAKKKEEKESCA